MEPELELTLLEAEGTVLVDEMVVLEKPVEAVPVVVVRVVPVVETVVVAVVDAAVVVTVVEVEAVEPVEAVVVVPDVAAVLSVEADVDADVPVAEEAVDWLGDVLATENCGVKLGGTDLSSAVIWIV